MKYSDTTLLNRIKKTKGYKETPKGYFFIFVRSIKDTPDKFDDKVYLFFGNKFVDLADCTTNSGIYGLLNFTKWNSKGTAVVEFDRAYYDGWKKGLHKGKVDAWVQNKPIYVYRDNDKDFKSEEQGEKEYGFFGINIHTISYNVWVDKVLNLIGQWSVGCLVINSTEKFRNWFKLITQEKIDVFLLKEF